MNPQASEFVPSWLTPAPAESAEPPANSWEDDLAQMPPPPSSLPPVVAPPPSSDPAPPVTALAAVSLADPATVASTIAPMPMSIGKTPVPTSQPPRPASASTASHEPPATVPDISEEVFNKVDFTNIIFDDKKPLNVVLLGHVDAGKSTISGHLLVLTGNVDERTMEKYEKEAKALNRESWKFAFALDTSEQERAKGKTEECGQASFTSKTRRFTILDAPGHKNYVPHMIGGASQADIGILVISARKGEFETGFERGGQTREHAMLAKTSGVRQMIVVINKLDDSSVLNADGTWSEQRFMECRTKLEPFLKQVGWNPKNLVWIPVSGLTGQNLKVKVEPKVCQWYQDESLLDTLETIRLPERQLSSSVKMPISEKHKEMGTMVMGKLESGVIQVNDKLTLMPNKVDIVVDALVLEGSAAQAAEPGDVVRLRIKGIEEEEVRVGFVLCSPSDLVSYTRSFTAKLMIIEHKSIICAGYSAVCHIHAAVEEVTIVKLLAELDKANKVKRKNPKFVKPGMKCVVRLKTALPVCVEPFDVFPQLGRFTIRDEGKTVGVGAVLKVNPMTPDQMTDESANKN